MRASTSRPDSVKRLSGIGSTDGLNFRTPQPCRVVERKSQHSHHRVNTLERYPIYADSPQVKPSAISNHLITSVPRPFLSSSRSSSSCTVSDPPPHGTQPSLDANEQFPSKSCSQPLHHTFHSSAMSGGATAVVASPRWNGSARRVMSCGPQRSKDPSLLGQPCTPLKYLRSRFGGGSSQDSYDAPSSMSRSTTATGHSGAVYKPSSKVMSCTSSSERGTSHVPPPPRSAFRSASASRQYARQTGLIARHGSFRDHITIFPETFENITLDPTRFSSEKVRRDAALVILRCLHLKKYSQPLLLQDLVHCPSTQQYINLMQFLFNQVDPSAEPFILEEKVTNMFKLLGYPLQFARSHFRSPCTPLMWPHHLASIAWLCALLIFDETVLCDLARPPMIHSASEHPQAVRNTPRVIGGFRFLSDEGKGSKEALDLHSKPSMGKSPRPFLASTNDQDMPPLDCLPSEPITVALVRIIQTTYMLHKQQCKEIQEDDLSRLLEADLMKYRAKEEAVLKEVLAVRDMEKEAYRIEKGKLDDIGSLQVQASEQMADCSRFDQRIQTTEKIIQDKKRHIEALKAESTRQSLYILELQQEIQEVSEKLAQQAISKKDVDGYVEKSQNQRRVLADLEEEISRADTENNSLRQRIQQKIDQIHEATTSCGELTRGLKTWIYELDDLQPEDFLEHFPFSFTFTVTPLSDACLSNLISKHSVTDLADLKCHHTDSTMPLKYTPQQKEGNGTTAKEAPLTTPTSSERDKETMLHDVDQLFQQCFQNISWCHWNNALGHVAEKQQNIFCHLKKKIKASEKIHTTLEKSVQLKLKKIETISQDMSRLEKILETKNAKYQSLLNELQESVKSPAQKFLSDEVRQLKETGLALQKELTKVRERKSFALKRLEDTEKRASEKLITWIKAAKEETGIVMSKLTSATQVVMEETQHIETLMASISTVRTEYTSSTSRG